MIDEKRDTIWTTIFPGLVERLGISMCCNTRILDFGCGHGEFVEEMRRAGLDASGTDFIDQLPQPCPE